MINHIEDNDNVNLVEFSKDFFSYCHEIKQDTWQELKSIIRKECE